MSAVRSQVKTVLSFTPDRSAPTGATVLTYHRVGGPGVDELDVPVDTFAAQLELLSSHDVVSIDTAIDHLRDGHGGHDVVLSFDDGFADVFENAWPLLRERRLPFVVYVASSFLGGTMTWPGSTARDQRAPALSWRQLEVMVDSGLCTIGNHTHRHVIPGRLSEEELDLCTDAVFRHVGVVPEHFAYPWGEPVERQRAAIGRRFRSAVTGRVGRNESGVDLLDLNRIPVRRSDPHRFFAAKFSGRLLPERAYGHAVVLAKRVGLHG